MPDTDDRSGAQSREAHRTARTQAPRRSHRESRRPPHAREAGRCPRCTSRAASPPRPGVRDAHAHWNRLERFTGNASSRRGLARPCADDHHIVGNGGRDANRELDWEARRSRSPATRTPLRQARAFEAGSVLARRRRTLHARSRRFRIAAVRPRADRRAPQRQRQSARRERRPRMQQPGRVVVALGIRRLSAPGKPERSGNERPHARASRRPMICQRPAQLRCWTCNFRAVELQLIHRCATVAAEVNHDPSRQIQPGYSNG